MFVTVWRLSLYSSLNVYVARGSPPVQVKPRGSLLQKFCELMLIMECRSWRLLSRAAPKRLARFLNLLQCLILRNDTSEGVSIWCLI